MNFGYSHGTLSPHGGFVETQPEHSSSYLDRVPRKKRRIASLRTDGERSSLLGVEWGYPELNGWDSRVWCWLHATQAQKCKFPYFHFCRYAEILLRASCHQRTGNRRPRIFLSNPRMTHSCSMYIVFGLSLLVSNRWCVCFSCAQRVAKPNRVPHASVR